MGIRLDRQGNLVCQNRTHVITSSSHAQFSSLRNWLHVHQESLKRLLYSTNCILFGEWMQSKHSIYYDSLQDYFCAFDLYDLEEKKFWSTSRFTSVVVPLGFCVAPLLEVPATLTRDTIIELIHQPSAFSTQSLREGVVLRRDSQDWMVDKAKVVRSDFIAPGTTQHWSSSTVVSNVIQS